MLAAKITQRPVGQGGLCEGRLFAFRHYNSGMSNEIRWVFDCGSNQERALHREIDKIDGEIDILFLSHVHADHVSGIEYLLKSKTVRQIVLPYLEPDTCLMLMAQAAAKKELTEELRSFLEGPGTWLRSRRDGEDGPTIVFVDGVDTDESDLEPPPAPELPVPEERIAEVDSRLDVVWLPGLSAPSADEEQVAPAGSQIAVTVGGVYQNWIFTPHVHKPSTARQTKFRAELSIKFPGKSDLEIAQEASTLLGQKKLRDCYNKLWKDHNLVSLSLYAGPLRSEPELRGDLFTQDAFAAESWSDERASYRYLRRYSAFASGKDWGWISTGDANLLRDRRRAAFCKTFSAYLEKVSVLLIPHHGSRHNWHSDLLSAMPKLSAGIAPAGHNTYGHPAPSVIEDFGKAGVPFYQVGIERRLSQVVIVP